MTASQIFNMSASYKEMIIYGTLFLRVVVLRTNYK